MRQPPGHPSLFDHWDRMAARVQAQNQALEHERQHGRGSRKHGGARAKWSLDRQRVFEIRHVIHHRHGGPCDTDDGPTYLKAALPHLLRLYGGGEEGRGKVVEWAAVWLPLMPEAEVVAAADKAFERDTPTLKADTLAALLNMHSDERTALSLKTIGAVDYDSRERKAERKRRNAAYQAEKRHRAGATPRAESKAATARALGISLSTLKRRLKRGGAETPEPISSAVDPKGLKATPKPGHGTGLGVPGPAREAGPKQAVGAGGLTPRSKPRAVAAGHARALPLPIEGFQEHPDLFGSEGEWISLGTALDYAGGLMPPEVARAVRVAQRVRAMTQEAVALHIGISRPQLANALRGRFGLSRSAAVNLMQWLAA